MPVKRLVCLANSRKPSGRCVAGIELGDGKPVGWVRPVSDRDHGEVSEEERQYEDGSDPRVLDIVEVPLKHPAPKNFQQENWLLDPEWYWTKIGKVSWNDLLKLVETPSPLWINGHGTYHGCNDKIPLDQAIHLTSSLRLIHVGCVTLSVFSPGAAFGNAKRRVQARFTHHGVEYRLRVTDPTYERTYLAKPNGDYSIGEACLSISIGEPFEGACYKLVAAIIERVNT